jgi:ABC-type multidrug transport system fused ATPase/permease subunit
VTTITHLTRLAVYQHQIASLDRRLSRLTQQANRWSWLRLGAFIGGIIASFALYFAAGTTAFWIALALTILVFAIAVFQHRKFETQITTFSLWREIKAVHVARIGLDWAKMPPTPFEATHPLAIDLDLVGPRSVHHLLDTTVAHEASTRLRDWLLNTAPDLSVIQHRQALVKELMALPLFRDKLTLRARLSTEQHRRRLRITPLLEWFQSHSANLSLRRTVILLGGLAFINIVLFLLATLHIIPPIWGVTFAIYFVWMGMTIRNLEDPFEDAMAVQEGLNKVTTVFKLLETTDYRQHSALKKECAIFLDPLNRPSRHLRKIGIVSALVGFRSNPLMWVFLNAVVPYDLFFAYLLNVYKREIAGLLPDWLNVWHELEALGSLATFGYLNPDHTFPELSAETVQPVFETQRIGHPLIPADRKVTNDLTLSSVGEVMIITGSNMAGKSTFLRTLGVNLCLAYAGAPVDAQRLHTGLFRVFTCIRVTDSVSDGFSYFYAEVRRLKALLDELNRDHAMPLFFLIDEIFRGTNNQERLIGSRAYIRALVGHNGLGAISTHDLELVKLAADSEQILNYHFREEVIEGQMVFDYKLRSGPCPTTNALKIMALEGLPVDDGHTRQIPKV